MSRNGSTMTDCPRFLYSQSVKLLWRNMSEHDRNVSQADHCVSHHCFCWLPSQPTTCFPWYMVTNPTAINHTIVKTGLVGSLSQIISYHADTVLLREVVVPSSGFSLFIYFRSLKADSFPAVRSAKPLLSLIIYTLTSLTDLCAYCFPCCPPEGDPGASPAPEAEGSPSQDAQGSGGPS